jgi:hypothetical protein
MANFSFMPNSPPSSSAASQIGKNCKEFDWNNGAKTDALKELRAFTVELAVFNDWGLESECEAFLCVRRCAGASTVDCRDVLRNHPGINRTTPTRSHGLWQRTVEGNGHTPASGMGLV